jgi:hypothetical protein
VAVHIFSIFSIDMVSLTGNIFDRPVIVYRSAIPDGIWSILTDMASTNMSSLTGFPLQGKTGGACFSTDMSSLTGFPPNDGTLSGRTFIAIEINTKNIR